MMANDKGKLATSSLIPLEIDPASILNLSKGVIFDTIVHNIEYTLNNRRTDPLPWKLIGMSLICDSSRNKKYMQKLQKMQCVPSVICTQIYHSKLVNTESGTLSTPGRKIVLPTSPRKRLTGIIICRSIDELLFMESSNTENVHFIQYKLLSYERIATRELVNKPKLSSISDRIIKTVFDFELSQNYGFPRQLLPVAIISFSRENGCDLCSSIRHFLSLDDHKTFDKSYLVTSTNVEFDRLREEQERKEDAEIEQELARQKIQRRQPLADLSEKSTGITNARPSSIPQQPARVAPLVLKLPRPEKASKPSVPILPIDSKFRCLLKLDRVDLSLYNISNLPTTPPIKPKMLTESLSSSNLINNKTKPFTITKQYEHNKSLKRLNNVETKKQTSFLPENSKQKSKSDSSSTRSSTSELSISLPTKKTIRSSSSSSSPIYRPKPTVKTRIAEKTVKKNIVKRPILPSEYHCSLSLMRIDLSMYELDLPPIDTSVNTLPMDTESTVIELKIVSVQPENTLPSTCMIEQENVHESKEENQQFFDTNTYQNLPNIIEEFKTPDLNDPESNSSNEVLPLSTNEIIPKTTDESSPIIANEVLPILMKDMVLEAISKIVTEDNSDKVPLEVTNEVIPTISKEENAKSTSSSSSSPPCIVLSPDLPPLNDDPVLFSIENPQIPITDTSDIDPQDCIIIVPCSDDEDEFDDIQNNSINNDSDSKVAKFSLSPLENNTSPILLNPPPLTPVFRNISYLKSHRLSTASLSSSCSSISISILHNQTPQSPLHLTHLSLPQKVLKKKQRKSIQTISFTQNDLCIPLITREPLIDPRLIYRLQAITTDLCWPNSCNQCLTPSNLPSSLLTSSTQTILYDRTSPLDFVDPRRDSLKHAILDSIYQRIKRLIPNIFIINSNQFQKLLFEQTMFKTNCSLHLEYLLHKIKITDDTNFFQMIKTTDEFQLSPFVLQFLLN